MELIKNQIEAEFAVTENEQRSALIAKHLRDDCDWAFAAAAEISADEQAYTALTLGYLLKNHRDELYHYAFEFIKACQSEIEKLMAVALLSREWWIGISLAGETFQQPLIDQGTLQLRCQAPIGKYRADFLLSLIDRGKIKRAIVIECDGHDFHEKTKEQARRDKARDRKMVALGYKVLRFTGSEIWKDPFQCAEEVYKIMDPIGYMQESVK